MSLNCNYFYFISIIVGIILIFSMFLLKGENKIKSIYYIIFSLLFGIVGLIVSAIFKLNMIIDNIVVIISLVFSLIFSIIVSKILYKNISAAILLSDGIKNHESSILIGLTGVCETNITIVGGVVLLISNKRISAKTYDKTINKGSRILITDYCDDDATYIVDHYPI